MDYNQENNVYMDDLAPQDMPVPPAGRYEPVRKKSFFARHRGLIIFLIILAVILGIAYAAANSLRSGGLKADGDTILLGTGDTLDLSEDYIGQLTVEGTIAESVSGNMLTGTSSYYHEWTLDMIDQMMADQENKALLLYVNSPGGTIYASDELYLKLKEYKETTGRPVYSYMASEAASGGYYISAAADRIIANRNCWTGSIGVTIGTLYDVSELLDKLGVSTVTITSGRNKAMGSTTDPMTKEQREIFQSLVDEAYDQFVGIVAEGRHMKERKVRKLADGRIYTAKQALENGLIDQIASYEEATAEIQRQVRSSAAVKSIEHKSDDGFLSSILMGAFGTQAQPEALSTYDVVKALLRENNTFTVTYLSNIRH